MIGAYDDAGPVSAAVAPTLISVGVTPTSEALGCSAPGGSGTPWQPLATLDQGAEPPGGEKVIATAPALREPAAAGEAVRVAALVAAAVAALVAACVAAAEALAAGAFVAVVAWLLVLLLLPQLRARISVANSGTQRVHLRRSRTPCIGAASPAEFVRMDVALLAGNDRFVVHSGM